MDSPLLLYERNSKTVKELYDIYNAVISHLPLLAQCADEILRAQLVLIVSAFDCYMHDCVRIGLMGTYCGLRDNAGPFQVSFELLVAIEKGETAQEKRQLLESALGKKLSEESYHSPKGVEHAMSLIGIKKIWTLLSANMHMNACDIRTQLGLIVDRRNKIVHEADYNLITGLKSPISISHVEAVVDFMDKCVLALDEIVFPEKWGEASADRCGRTESMVEMPV